MGGYRKVEIEMDDDEADEDPFGGDNEDEEIELDDLPDLEQPVAPELTTTLEPSSTPKTDLFSIVDPAKPDPVSELLFTKVDPSNPAADSESSKPKKMLIEEIE